LSRIWRGLCLTTSSGIDRIRSFFVQIPFRFIRPAKVRANLAGADIEDFPWKWSSNLEEW
jgi:hypothetical protein